MVGQDQVSNVLTVYVDSFLILADLTDDGILIVGRLQRTLARCCHPALLLSPA